MPSSRDLATSSLDQPAIIPARLVDGLSLLQLPAGEVHVASPHHSDRAPEAIDSDGLIPDGPELKSFDKAAFGRLPVTWSADAVTRAMLNLRRIYAEQPNARVATMDRVAVNDVSSWTGKVSASFSQREHASRDTAGRPADCSSAYGRGAVWRSQGGGSKRERECEHHQTLNAEATFAKPQLAARDPLICYFLVPRYEEAQPAPGGGMVRAGPSCRLRFRAGGQK